MSDRCRHCNAPIRWATTAKGRRMPLDAEPATDPGHGNVVILDPPHPSSAPLVQVYATPAAVPEGLVRWVPHFAFCPGPGKQRQR